MKIEYKISFYSSKQVSYDGVVWNGFNIKDIYGKRFHSEYEAIDYLKEIGYAGEFIIEKIYSL